MRLPPSPCVRVSSSVLLLPLSLSLSLALSLSRYLEILAISIIPDKKNSLMQLTWQQSCVCVERDINPVDGEARTTLSLSLSPSLSLSRTHSALIGIAIRNRY